MFYDFRGLEGLHMAFNRNDLCVILLLVRYPGSRSRNWRDVLQVSQASLEFFCFPLILPRWIIRGNL